MKKVTALILIMTLCVSAMGLTSCARAPKVDDIYDRVVELVEGANELNTVFYGAGMPVYKTDSTYANLTHMYHGFDDAGDYEMVTPYAKFATVSQIEQAAEKIYSKVYLESVVYPAMFTGYAIQGVDGVQVAGARYMEDLDWIYQSTDSSQLYKGMIVYDYSTMKVVAPSNREACYVTMNAWMEDTPEKVKEIQIRLVLEEGNWYLDSFTGGTV